MTIEKIIYLLALQFTCSQLEERLEAFLLFAAIFPNITANAQCLILNTSCISEIVLPKSGNVLILIVHRVFYRERFLILKMTIRFQQLLRSLLLHSQLSLHLAPCFIAKVTSSFFTHFKLLLTSILSYSHLRPSNLYFSNKTGYFMRCFFFISLLVVVFAT